MVYLLRDIGVAFLIVAVVMAAIFAYTRVWPPMVVVESASMQHGSTESHIGTIDTGDLVLVQAAPNRGDVTTYVEARASGYQTYGDYGDVIVFLRDGNPDEIPIIHWAMVYLQWNRTVASGGFDAADLAKLNKTEWSVTRGGAQTHIYLGLTAGDTLNLFQVGFRNLPVPISIDSFLQLARQSPQPYSGYVTMGDNNAPNYDVSWFAKQEWIIGRARGELPWFGLIKLTLFRSEGNTCRGWGDSSPGCAPANSWTSLNVALVLLIAAPIGFDVSSFLWKKYRRQGTSEDEEKEEGEGED
jgi:signal peptidase